MKKMYMLEDLDCANCAAKMEAAINKMPQVEKATVSFMTYLAQKLTLEADDARYDDILAEVVKTCKRVEPDCRILLK